MDHIGATIIRRLRHTGPTATVAQTDVHLVVVRPRHVKVVARSTEPQGGLFQPSDLSDLRHRVVLLSPKLSSYCAWPHSIIELAPCLLV